MSFNEETKRQTQRGALCSEAGNKTAEAQESGEGKTSSTPSASPQDREAKTSNKTKRGVHPQAIVVDEAQDVVSKFLQKNEERAEEYIDILGSMLGDDYHYGFAYTTLLGIYDFIEKHGYITEKQVEAIENIRKSPYER